MSRLIEEEEAFKVLSAYYNHSTPVQDSALHDALSRVPTAQPKRGKWFYQDTMYSCNQCHSQFYDMSPFCPCCGARMDEDE